MPDSHDSPLLLPSDTLSPSGAHVGRFDEPHPYRTPSGRRRLLDERRQTSLALERAEEAAAERKRLRKELAHLDELLRVRSDRAIDQISVRTKCRRRWDRMTPTDSGLGPDTVRHCEHCRRDVFDLSKMTEEDVEALLARPGQTPCVRFHRRPDGRVVTAPCPPRGRPPVLYGIGVAAGGALLATSLFTTAQLGGLDRRGVAERVHVKAALPPAPSHAVPPPAEAPPVRTSSLRSTPEPESGWATMGEPSTPDLSRPRAPLDRPGDIRRLGRRTWQLRRSFVDRVLDSTSQVMRSSRVIPHEEDGRVVGVKIYGVRRDSLLARMGMRNGDMLISLNGHSLVEPHSALDGYSSLRRRAPVNRVSLRIRRAGQERVHVYRIVN